MKPRMRKERMDLREGMIVYAPVDTTLAMASKEDNRKVLNTLLEHPRGLYSRGRKSSSRLSSMLSNMSTIKGRSYAAGVKAGAPRLPCIVLWAGYPTRQEFVMAPIVDISFSIELKSQNGRHLAPLDRNFTRQMCYPIPDTPRHQVLRPRGDPDGIQVDEEALQDVVHVPMWKYRSKENKGKPVGMMRVDQTPQQVILGAPIKCSVDALRDTASSTHDLKGEDLEFCREKALNEMCQNEVEALQLISSEREFTTPCCLSPNGLFFRYRA